ncbi:MAG TPA: SIR2 family protein [Chthoniobacteraceae bacterium]|jgi:hypothetical protein|nr:SIR2 family protein [Chthoniobacteraceae bacterium]
MAEYFERCPTLFGRPSLHQHLQDALGAQADWCPIHEYLAKVAATKPLLIFTTNYDDLMERAIRSTGAQCDVIMYTPHHHEGVKLLWCPDGREPREVLANALAAEPDYQPTKRTTLFKLHGSIAVQPQDDEQGHYVATLDDYAQALVQMGREQLIPTAFSEPMEKRPFLFLGYSLRDINVRHLLTEITARRGRTTMHSVAFQGSAGRAAVDLRDIDHELWNLRGVKIHYVTCDELVAQLKRLDPP